MTGLMTGAASASKLSALVLFPSLALMFIFWMDWRGLRQLNFLKSIAAAAVAFALVWICVYQSNFPAIKNCFFAERGVQVSMSTSRYLLGELPVRWHWIYYPVALLIKTPLPLLFMWIMAAALFVREGNMLQDRRRISILVFPSVLFIVLVFSQSRAGWRYFLPAVPLLAVFTGSAMAWLRGRTERMVFFGLLGWLAIETIAAHPYHMAYFNELIGGSRNGYRWLDGSNQDWGQDIPSLVKLVDQQKVKPAICLGYWGSNRPEAWGLEYQDVFSAAITNKFREETVNDPRAPREWLVVSAYLRTNRSLRNAYNWLYDRKPIACVGNTLFVYDISTDEESVRQIGEIYRMMGRPALAQRQAERLVYLASLRS